MSSLLIDPIVSRMNEKLVKLNPPKSGLKSLEAYVHEALENDTYLPEFPAGGRLTRAILIGRNLAQQLANEGLMIPSRNLGTLGVFYSDDALEEILRIKPNDKTVIHMINDLIANQFDRLASFIEIIAKRSDANHYIKDSYAFQTQEGYKFRIQNTKSFASPRRDLAYYSAEFGDLYMNKYSNHHNTKSNSDKPGYFIPNPNGWQAGSHSKLIEIGHRTFERGVHSTKTLEYEIGLSDQNHGSHMKESIHRRNAEKPVYEIESPNEDDVAKTFERSKTAFQIDNAHYFFKDKDGY